MTDDADAKVDYGKVDFYLEHLEESLDACANELREATRDGGDKATFLWRARMSIESMYYALAQFVPKCAKLVNDHTDIGSLRSDELAAMLVTARVLDDAIAKTMKVVLQLAALGAHARPPEAHAEQSIPVVRGHLFTVVEWFFNHRRLSPQTSRAPGRRSERLESALAVLALRQERPSIREQLELSREAARSSREQLDAFVSNAKDEQRGLERARDEAERFKRELRDLRATQDAASATTIAENTALRRRVDDLAAEREARTAAARGNGSRGGIAPLAVGACFGLVVGALVAYLGGLAGFSRAKVYHARSSVASSAESMGRADGAYPAPAARLRDSSPERANGEGDDRDAALPLVTSSEILDADTPDSGVAMDASFAENDIDAAVSSPPLRCPRGMTGHQGVTLTLGQPRGGRADWPAADPIVIGPIAVPAFCLQQRAVPQVRFDGWRNSTEHPAAAGCRPPSTAGHPPAVCVTDQEAAAYCAAKGWWLPTVAQWEVIAREQNGRVDWSDAEWVEDLYPPSVFNRRSGCTGDVVPDSCKHRMVRNGLVAPGHPPTGAEVWLSWNRASLAHIARSDLGFRCAAPPTIDARTLPTAR